MVSASAETKKITNIGSSGSQYQPQQAEARVLRAHDVDRFIEPAHRSTVTMTKPIETS